MQISSNIAYLLMGLNVDEGTSLTYDFNYPIVTLKGKVWNLAKKQQAIAALHKIQGIDTINR